MHSNIYSRDEMRHALARHRFVCYCVECMREISNSCPARMCDQQSSSSLLQPQRAGLWLEALAVRDALYEPISERCGTVRQQCWPPCCSKPQRLRSYCHHYVRCEQA